MRTNTPHIAYTTKKAMLFILVTITGAWVLACAHVGDHGQYESIHEINVIASDGTRRNLGDAVGTMVVIDICAAWNDACLHNAQMIDRACREICDDSLQMMTVLLDDLYEQAMQSYRDVLGVQHPIYRPSAEFREGNTSFGPLNEIPRLLVFDRRGRLIEDIRGGVISSDGLIQQLAGSRK